MKLHRPLALHIISALQQTFEEGYHADKVIERLFKHNRRLGARDRRFIAETTYEIVRWWRLLWSAMGRQDPSLDESSLLSLLGVYFIVNEMPLAPWKEFQSLDVNLIRKNLRHARTVPAIRESVPDWLYELGSSELGSEWDHALAAMNQKAPVVLRANRIKTSREDLQNQLAHEGIESEIAPSTEDGLTLPERKNVFATQSFRDGLFEVQDGASQQVSPLLEAETGMRVIDACAGAGGKTLHLASIMRNKGKIISMDVHQRKLDELRKRCTRAGVDIVETKLIESTKTIKRLEHSAHRLLLDVPCSGLGVLRRNPDSKWKLSLDEVHRLQLLQAQILSDYSSMLKPGGRMVYATCSILPSENEKQIEAFLKKKGSSWKLIEEKKFRPGHDGYDGFYAAALERID